MEDRSKERYVPQEHSAFALGLQRLNDRIAIEREIFDPSLESVVSVETEISSWDDQPLIRGYPLIDFVRQGTYSEFVFLLLFGRRPSAMESADFESLLNERRVVDPRLTEMVKQMRGFLSEADLLRTLISIRGESERVDRSLDSDAVCGRVIRQMCVLPQLLFPVEMDDSDEEELDFVSDVLFRITKRTPSVIGARAFEVFLMTYVEQGVDAATLAMRTAISTGASLDAALTAAMAVSSGPLQVGPRGEMIHAVQQAQQMGVEAYLDHRLENGHQVAGFDPRLEVDGDSRNRLLLPYCQELAEQVGCDDWEVTARRLRSEIAERTQAGMTLDFTASRMLFYLGISPEKFATITAWVRLVGWAVHAMEQSQRNQMVRPRSRYCGPKLREFSEVDDEV